MNTTQRSPLKLSPFVDYSLPLLCLPLWLLLWMLLLHTAVTDVLAHDIGMLF